MRSALRDLTFFAARLPEVRRAWATLREAQKDLFLEAARQGKDYFRFAKWLEKQIRDELEKLENLVTNARLHVEGDEAEFYGGETDEILVNEPEQAVVAGWAKPIVTALERLTQQYQSLQIPATLRGRTRGKRLDGASLLKGYGGLYRRAREFLRKHRYPVGAPGPEQTFALLGGFPDAEPEDLVLIEQRKPGQFARAVLARWERASTHTIRKYLIEARKTAGRARPKSRIRRPA